MRIRILSIEKQHEIARISSEAERRGHTVKFILLDGKTKTDSEFGFDFDVLLIRAVRGFAGKAKEIARLAVKRGINVVDARLAGAGSRSKYENYMLFRKAGLYVPRMFLLRKAGDAVKAGRLRTEDVVVKDVNGKRGEGLYKCKNNAAAVKALFARLHKSKKNRKNKFMVQEFVPAEHELRIFVVGGKVLGAFSKETKKWRHNVARGARAVKFRATPAQRKTAVKAAHVLETEIAGVDIGIAKGKRLFVLEVNRSPQFRGFERSTGVNAALEIVKYLEGKAKNKARGKGKKKARNKKKQTWR
ncbi:RimK family alpha-L-glutamate ligase [Candidatus Micrarchaeota archaeon]|nr:RimK family alpha-L-glutamate ligase [Candidatus Micrarchaeota archaeon]